MQKKIPQLKKKISGFLSNEQGTISKKSIMKLGLITSLLSTSTEDVSGGSEECHNSDGTNCDHHESSSVTLSSSTYNLVDAGNPPSAHASDSCSGTHSNSWADDCSCHANASTADHASDSSGHHTNDLEVAKKGTGIKATHEHNVAHASQLTGTPSSHCSLS